MDLKFIIPDVKIHDVETPHRELRVIDAPQRVVDYIAKNICIETANFAAYGKRAPLTARINELYELSVNSAEEFELKKECIFILELLNSDRNLGNYLFNLVHEAILG